MKFRQNEFPQRLNFIYIRILHGVRHTAYVTLLPAADHILPAVLTAPAISPV